MNKYQVNLVAMTGIRLADDEEFTVDLSAADHDSAILIARGLMLIAHPTIPPGRVWAWFCTPDDGQFCPEIYS
jgi:hypothetical protein